MWLHCCANILCCFIYSKKIKFITFSLEKIWLDHGSDSIFTTVNKFTWFKNLNKCPKRKFATLFHINTRVYIFCFFTIMTICWLNFFNHIQIIWNMIKQIHFWKWFWVKCCFISNNNKSYIIIIMPSFCVDFLQLCCYVCCTKLDHKVLPIRSQNVHIVYT